MTTRQKLLRVVAPVHDPASVVLEDLNDTELLTIARQAEVPGAFLSATRTELLAALQTISPLPYRDPMATTTRRFKTWVRRYWDVVSMQLPYQRCRRGDDAPNCHECRDVQRAKCWTENSHQIT